MKAKVRQHLTDLEISLRTHKQWDAVAPSLEDLANDQPFCIGTLSPTQWLQWIFYSSYARTFRRRSGFTPQLFDYALLGRSPKRRKLFKSDSSAGVID